MRALHDASERRRCRPRLVDDVGMRPLLRTIGEFGLLVLWYALLLGLGLGLSLWRFPLPE
jgi:hypothetical protein